MTDMDPMPGQVIASRATSLERVSPEERGSTGLLKVVARNATYVLASQVIIKILALIFNVYIVRRLGSVHYGRYAAAQAYVSMFAILTDLGLSPFSVREIARNRARGATLIPNVMALRAILSTVAIMGITLSAWLLGKKPDMVFGIFVASCGLLLYAFQGPLENALIAHERLDLTSTFMVLNQFTFMATGALLLLSGRGYVGLLFASLLGILAHLLASAATSKRALGLRFGRVAPQQWVPLIKSGLPFGISGLAGELSRRFDTVFMSFVLAEAAVGWYNVPYQLVLMTLVLAQSVAVSMYPSLVRQYDSGRGSIRDTVQRAIRYLLMLSLPLAVGGAILADRVILVLYGHEFAPAIGVMRILVWGLPLMFVAEILGRTSSTMHLERRCARIDVVNALVRVPLVIILVPRVGITGAAVAMVATWILWVAQASIIIGWALLFEGNVRPLLRVAAAGALLGAIIWPLSHVSWLTVLGGKLELLFLVGAGALVYGAGVLLFGAVSHSEVARVHSTLRQRLDRLLEP